MSTDEATYSSIDHPIPEKRFMACCPVAIPRAENLFQDVFGQIQTGQFSPSVYIYICIYIYIMVGVTIFGQSNPPFQWFTMYLYIELYMLFITYLLLICLFVCLCIYIFIYLFSHSYVYISQIYKKYRLNSATVVWLYSWLYIYIAHD